MRRAQADDNVAGSNSVPSLAGFWIDAQADPVVQAVMAAIAAGRLPAGTKLGEEELGRIFGIGRTRVRQGLYLLSFAGLVTLEPNRGAFVASPSLAEARAVYAARRLIESEIVRDATRHCTANDIRRLRAHCAVQEEARVDQNRFIRLLSEFHLLVADLGGNPVLAELLAQLLPRTALMQALYQPPGRGGGSCAVKHHLSIIQMMAKGDEEGVANAMCLHLTDNLMELRTSSAEQEVSLATVLAEDPVK